MYVKDRDLYKDIREGRKKSEWRDDTEYWRKRLIVPFLTKSPAIDNRFGGVRAWFVCGYPKGNLPRLEATIWKVVDDWVSGQIEVKFKDVVEVKT